MRTKKFLAVISAAAVFWGVSLQAQSSSGPTMPGPNLSGSHLTPEQEQQLREQLHKTISNINAQSGSTAAPVTPTPAAPVAPAPAPVTTAPMAPATPVTPAPAASTSWKAPTAPAAPQGFNAPVAPPANSMTPEQEEKIRVALRQAEGKGAPGMGQQPQVPANLNAEQQQKVLETLHQAEMDMAAKDRAAAAEAARAAKAKQDAALAARQKEFSAQASDKAAADKAAAEKAAQDAMKQKQVAQQNAPIGTMATPTPTPAPASMAAGSKDQRLYDLLQLYKADKISPTEYHQQRAKIIAEP